MNYLFLEFAGVLVLCSVLGIVARYLKQPLVLAYIFAGIVISVLGLFKHIDRQVLDLLSNFGIAFLLFLVGIELRLEDFKYVGKAAIFTGVGQILFTALLGFILVSYLGFSPVSSLYVAFALTFSSTVVIIKLLAEKHDLESLYGRMTVGILLIQDFFAVLILMVLSGFGGGQSPSTFTFVLILAKGLFLVAVSYLAARFVLRFLFKISSSSVELLFVSAIAWAFFMAALGEAFGFSLAIGAFLAGVAIASSPYRIEISSRTKPLRDFFIIIFFILLGASLSTGASQVLISNVALISLFILICKPLIVFTIMITMGFRNRTAFLSSVSGAQISEFSLILVTVGSSIGHVSYEAVSLVSAVGIVTFTLSSYLILYGENIYKFMEKPINKIFPQKVKSPYVVNREGLKDHTVLVGCEQMGWDILNFLKSKYESKENILVVDFNPEIVKSVSASGFNGVFGDIGDSEVLEEMELSKAKLIITTDPTFSDVELLIKTAREKNYKGPIIAASYWIHDAIKMYEAGADYVVVPETVGGKHIARLLSERWDNLNSLKKEKSKHFEELMSHKIF